jgi:ribose 5-phosphate isomerase B
MTTQDSPTLHVAVGADDAATDLKEALLRHLAERSPVPVVVHDMGLHPQELADPDAEIDYPDVAERVALAVRAGEVDRGILLCGTGIGVAIAANKVPGIRAACCHDPYSAERARMSNDAQILTMGARIVAPQLAAVILDTWLRAEFAGGGSTRKVEKIANLEQRMLDGKAAA